jgi:hypothetical protein
MGYREFVDASGTEWRAWETRPRTGANVRRALAAGWLSFENEDERRRLTPVPRGWDGGSEDDLRVWLGRAKPVAVVGPDAESEAPEGSPEAELSGRTGNVLRRAREVLRTVEETLKRARDAPPPE